jgi:drug/metabolite transporter (DMT)-like permease
MAITRNKAMLGMMLSAFGFSLYSIGDIFIKFAAAHYPPEKVAFFINMFFFPLILTVSGKVGGLRATLKTKHLKLHLLRSVLGMIVFFCMTTGFVKLGMAMSYTLIFSGPFIVSILSIFFLGEKIGVHRWSAIVMGFAGVLIVLRPGLNMELAAAGILLAAFCYAGSTLIIRKIGEGEPLLAFSFYGQIVSTTLFGALMLYKGEMSLPAIEHLWFFAATAVFHVFVNFSVSRAFQISETSVAAPFQYVQLLWGIGAGLLLFHQGIDVWTGLGGAIIVGSGVYMIHRERVRHSELNTGVVAHGGALEDTGLNIEKTKEYSSTEVANGDDIYAQGRHG